MPLTVGQPAPEFELRDDTKKTWKLSDLRGRKVVLLFYPLDFSSVCTAEHCEFGPRLDEIKTDDQTLVFGVSCDSVYCHAAYRKQYGIPYPLLSDPTRRMAKAYDMWAGEEPNNSTKRGTVIIDSQGKIAFWHEQPMGEARRIADLSAQVSRIH
jgi:peroxiredoxin